MFEEEPERLWEVVSDGLKGSVIWKKKIGMEVEEKVQVKEHAFPKAV